MSFDLSLSFKGVKGAQNALKQFPVEISDQVETFLNDIGETVYMQMISLVPVDTGALRDSIDYNVESDGTLNFEATQPYAGFVEYGTVKMEAQPFFNPPLDTLQASGISEDFGRDALSNWDKLVSEHENE